MPDIINSPSDQAGYAQVLPDYNREIISRQMAFDRVNTQHRKDKEAQAKADADRKNMLGKYLADELADKNFATGDADYDPLIKGKLGEVRKKWNDIILKGKTSIPEINFGLESDLKQIVGLSDKYKALDASLKEGISGMKKALPEMDANAWYNVAKNDAIHTTDEKGNRILITDPDKIDLSQPWIANTLKNHPEKILMDGDAWKNNYKDKTIKAASVVDVGGIKTNQGFEASGIPQFHSFKMGLDKNNKTSHILLGNDGLPILQTNGEDSPIGTVMPQNKFDLYISDIHNRSKLGAAFALENKKLKTPIDPDSPAGILMQKKIAYDLVDSLKGNVNKVKDEVSAAEQYRLGAAMHLAAYKAALRGDGANKNSVDFSSIGEGEGIVFTNAGKGRKIVNGVVYNEKNEPIQEGVVIKTTDLPSRLLAVLESSKMKVDPETYPNISIETNSNGQITSITPTNEKGNKGNKISIRDLGVSVNKATSAAKQSGELYKGSTQQYKIGKDDYTADELMNAGWTEEKLQEALKKGSIKKK